MLDIMLLPWLLHNDAIIVASVSCDWYVCICSVFKLSSKASIMVK